MVVFILSILFSYSNHSFELEEVREQFTNISCNKDIRLLYLSTKQLSSEQATHLAYKGVARCMMAKVALNPIEKIHHFSTGKKQINAAIDKAPENLEIRLLRNLIQQNAPRFLNYSCNIQEDRSFIESELSLSANDSTISIYQNLYGSASFQHTERLN